MTTEQEAELVVALERAVHVGVLAPRIGPTIRALLEERRALIAFAEAVAEYDEYTDDSTPFQILGRIEDRARAALALAARKVE